MNSTQVWDRDLQNEYPAAVREALAYRESTQRGKNLKLFLCFLTAFAFGFALRLGFHFYFLEVDTTTASSSQSVKAEGGIDKRLPKFGWVKI